MNINALQSVLLCWLQPTPVAGCNEVSLVQVEEKPVSLRRGQVMTICKKSPARIEVLRGTIWLTGTPAEKDVVLQAGDEFRLADGEKFVIEALTDAEIILAD